MNVKRRDFLGAGLFLGGSLLAGWPGSSRSQTALPASFALYGQLPADRPIQRVLVAGPPAAVLVYCLAPHALLGWPYALSPAARAELAPVARTLPQLGRLSGRGSTLALETLLALKPDLIIDTGTLNETYRSTARRTAQQTGVPYLLIDGDILLSAQTLRALGVLLGVHRRGTQLAQQAQAILDQASALREHFGKHQTDKQTGRAPTFYAARGADGLETAPHGSIHTQALELCGLRNVVSGPGDSAPDSGFNPGRNLGRVSLEQLLLWQPDTIFTHNPVFHAQVRQSPYWQRLRAVRTGRVVLAPSAPFGWLDMPPGMNRLLGVHWISQTVRVAMSAQNTTQHTTAQTTGNARSIIQERLLQFCELFYQQAPSAALLEAAAAFSVDALPS